jgi:hypothetical protein
MNYIPFSTGGALQLDVNVSGLAGFDWLFTSSGLVFSAFPQILSHQPRRSWPFFVKGWLAISTFPQGLLLVLRINTSLSFLARLEMPRKTVEVCHAIQR